ncbi:MAG: hypothetical protein AMQ22_01753 [Candidatus Methanofastidiosum methylothiophilum]|uniref:Uncharacterized protein n=1 Tax=Candidatus Methanofastidiosum methylothiophilum TaxID=1705564 RepID=A0A150IVZ6_9EURY|nr:MAG: hypothetical protein AMQ22_01753 [Candidatus Methanofastidiosum methylthiophilus]
MYKTASNPPKRTYPATIPVITIRARLKFRLNVDSIILAAPIMTTDAYKGMNIVMRSPKEPCKVLELNLLPTISGNVNAPKLCPTCLALLPQTTNAKNIPTKIFMNVSQRRPIPNIEADPPNPTIADVLIKVAP